MARSDWLTAEAVTPFRSAVCLKLLVSPKSQNILKVPMCMIAMA
jgi:hypothetical protein